MAGLIEWFDLSNDVKPYIAHPIRLEDAESIHAIIKNHAKNVRTVFQFFLFT